MLIVGTGVSVVFLGAQHWPFPPSAGPGATLDLNVACPYCLLLFLTPGVLVPFIELYSLDRCCLPSEVSAVPARAAVLPRKEALVCSLGSS